MSTVDISQLNKRYDDGDEQIVAVKDFDVEIEDGEFLVLVGPSGCGKSTTLRCLAGLETVTSGEIFLDGTPITNKQPMERDMAMVFQSYALYPHMTARENMAFGLKMTTELSKDEIHGKVKQTAEMMGIENLLGKKPGDLSGGQQQRVALGRAIVRDPAVFLMDEPLSNLDAKLRTTMRTELQNLQQELGVTTIYVTHDQTEAMTMGDRIAILNNGKLQQIGTPLECYHQPQNRFVAGFIGSPSMNFLTVERHGNTFQHPDFEYILSDEVVNELTDNRTELVLGIRPEDIELVKEPTDNSIPATAQVVEPTGDVSYVYIPFDDKTITVSVTGDTPVQDGQRLYLIFPPEKIHLFDAASGETIRNRDAQIDKNQPHL